MASESMMAYRSNIRAWLILEDGTIFEGWNMGAQGTTMGEVVFTTGCTAYKETLTDPGFYGQIVTQTFPLIGNRGLDPDDMHDRKVWLSGYIIREWCYEPADFKTVTTLGEYLAQENIVGIYDIDTRALTRRLRNKGVMNGAITTEYPEDMAAFIEKIKATKIVDAVKTVSVTTKSHSTVYNPIAKVALMDFGYDPNLVAALNKRDCDVVIVPYNTSAKEIIDLGVDGVLLSNGPETLEGNDEVIAIIKDLLASKLPIMGCCLGHLLLAQASGAKIEKMKYGHRGSNQPAKDLEIDRVFVTCQNHGYSVVSETVTPEIGKLSHVNVNDGSCEGIEYKRPNTFSVQFSPEASGGPQDTEYIFDKFIKNMTGGAK